MLLLNILSFHNCGQLFPVWGRGMLVNLTKKVSHTSLFQFTPACTITSKVSILNVWRIFQNVCKAMHLGHMHHVFTSNFRVHLSVYLIKYCCNMQMFACPTVVNLGSSDRYSDIHCTVSRCSEYPRGGYVAHVLWGRGVVWLSNPVKMDCVSIVLVAGFASFPSLYVRCMWYSLHLLQ